MAIATLNRAELLLDAEVRGEIRGLFQAYRSLENRVGELLYGDFDDAEYALDNPEYRYVPSPQDELVAAGLRDASAEMFEDICQRLLMELPLSRARRLAVIRAYHNWCHQEWDADYWKSVA